MYIFFIHTGVKDSQPEFEREVICLDDPMQGLRSKPKPIGRSRKVTTSKDFISELYDNHNFHDVI